MHSHLLTHTHPYLAIVGILVTFVLLIGIPTVLMCRAIPVEH